MSQSYPLLKSFWATHKKGIQMIILYGLATCDTVKKARYWLETHQIEHKFYEIRRYGLSAKLLRQFASQLSDWQILINRKGTTWRKFSDEQKQACDKLDSAIETILANPTVMKRPVLDIGDKVIVGFDAKVYETTFL